MGVVPAEDVRTEDDFHHNAARAPLPQQMVHSTASLPLCPECSGELHSTHSLQLLQLVVGVGGDVGRVEVSHVHAEIQGSFLRGYCGFADP